SIIGRLPAAVALWRQADDGAALARLGSWGERRAYEKTVGARKRHEHGAILHRRRRRHRNAVGTGRQRRAQIVGALVGCRQLAAQSCRLGRGGDIAAPGEPPNERKQEQNRTDISGDWITWQS